MTHHRMQLTVAFATLVGLTFSLEHSTAHAQIAQGATCRQEDFEAFVSTLKPFAKPIELRVTPNKSTWRVGEKVRISVAAGFAGRLVLLSVDAKDVVVPLYPSANTGKVEDRITPNALITLPRPGDGYFFEAQPPLGPSRLIAIVRPLDVEALPLECARGLTRGEPIRLRRVGRRPSSATADPLAPAGDPLAQGPVDDPLAPKPTPLKGWGFAEFRYTMTP